MEKFELEIKNLNLYINENKILKDINLKVKKGEIYCLIGPNGGGKTSLIKCILNELDYTGKISFYNERKEIISYVPQHINLNKDIPLSVEEFISINTQLSPCFLDLNTKKRFIIDNLLKTFKIQDKRKALFSTLSGGERQRVLLLQALLPKPDLLILDEPLTGMDKNGEEFFIHLIKRLKNQGITILWIEHNLNKVKEFADNITCINKESISCDILNFDSFDAEISRMFFR